VRVNPGQVNCVCKAQQPVRDKLGLSAVFFSQLNQREVYPRQGERVHALSSQVRVREAQERVLFCEDTQRT
jgi:hypothetical protein